MYDYQLGQTSFVVLEETTYIDITIVELPPEDYLNFLLY
jgi:hypothetical protein